MTIQSKHGATIVFPGTHIRLSTHDLETIEQHIQANQGSGATFIGYHKRRKRSTWLDRNGQYRFCRDPRMTVLKATLAELGEI